MASQPQGRRGDPSPVRQGGSTIALLPLAAFAALLLGAWVGADYYATHTIIVQPSPELPVWAAYSRQAAGPLIGWALVGLFIAALLPSWRAPRAAALRSEIVASAARLGWLWWALATAALVASVLVKGQYLLSAPAYLAFAAPEQVVGLAGAVQPLGVLATGVVSVKRPVLGLLGLVAWAVVLFGYGTRVFAGVLVLYVIGRWLGGAAVRLSTWLVAGLSVLLLLPIPLISRSLNEHGLLPYWAGVSARLGEPGYLRLAAESVASNIGFGIPLLVETSQQTSITPGDLLISINPAPSSIAGWSDIASSMRVHLFIPYSALGEWARFGPWGILGFTLIWGTIVRTCILSVIRSSSGLKIPFLAAVMGLALITVVLSLQYNTRAVARMMDLIILLAIGERVVAALLRHRPDAAGDVGQTLTGSEYPTRS